MRITSGMTWIGVACLLSIHMSVCLAVDCQFSGYDDNNNYASYDLRPLVSPTTYVFRAKIGSYHYRYHGQQYDYLINVCDDVHPDAKHSACAELAHSPAFQVTAPPAPTPPPSGSSKYTPPPPPPYEPACFRIADSGDVKFDFLNKSDPEEGVKIMYRGGQKCRKRNTPEVIKETNETWRDADREVELWLKCDREMGLDPSAAVTDLINSGATIQVEEKSPPDECQYIVQWRTPHACPYGSGFAAKVVPQSVPSFGTGGGGGSWLWWIVKWTAISCCVLAVVLLVLCIPQLRKRVEMYQKGHVESFGQFVMLVMGDLHVRLQQLRGSRTGSRGTLPMSHGGMGGLGHEHTV